jgi:UDP-N-acetylglucosamine/UDP-N-acetylgalactosamine 4-epimerase
VVQANLRAAMTENPAALNQAYNVAHGDMTTLNELFEIVRALLAKRRPQLKGARAVHREPRRGDIALSRADIGKARELLGYAPALRLMDGLEQTMDWYVENLAPVETRRAANV